MCLSAPLRLVRYERQARKKKKNNGNYKNFKFLQLIFNLEIVIDMAVLLLNFRYKNLYI
jgi:hypothetical protein